jgi:hypothetical protein
MNYGPRHQSWSANAQITRRRKSVRMNALQSWASAIAYVIGVVFLFALISIAPTLEANFNGY